MKKRIFTGLLTACFLFVHVIGSVVAFEVEHSHHGDAEHDHDFGGYRVSSSSHEESGHHDHAPAKHDEENQPEDDSPPPSHSHVLLANAAVAAHVSISFVFNAKPAALGESFRWETERCPDGPSFEVTKPPQLV